MNTPTNDADLLEGMAPGMGHNLPALPGVTDAIVREFFHDMERLEGQKAEIQERIKKRRKQAKADGIPLEMWKLAMKLMDGTEDEAEEKLTQVCGMLRALRFKIGDQMALPLGEPPAAEDIPDEIREALIVERAERDGWREGLAGQKFEDDNPHDATSAAGQSWIKGYRAGQEAQVNRMSREAAE